MSWKNKIALNDGDVLEFISTFEAGHLGQEERKHYEVKNRFGIVISKVKYTEHMSTKVPFTKTYSLQQFDADGKVLISEHW